MPVMELELAPALVTSKEPIVNATVHVTFQTTPTFSKTNGQATTTVKRKTQPVAWVVPSVHTDQVPLLKTVPVPFHSQKNQPTSTFLMLISERMSPQPHPPGTSVPLTASLNQVKMELLGIWFTLLQVLHSAKKMLFGTVTQLMSTPMPSTHFHRTT
jgi:hypothetical protein